MYILDEIERAGVTGIATAASILAIPLWWLYQHQKFKRNFGEATYEPAFAPLTLLGMVFGLGLKFNWDLRFTLYRKIKREVILLKPTIWGKPVMYTNSMEVLRQVAGGGPVTPWHRPPWALATTIYWGKSVFTSNDQEWKKHRRVLQPAFNPKMYEMVWSETTRFFNEMIVADKWPTTPNETKPFTRAQAFTQRLALCVILSCGFGLPIKWNEKTYAEDGIFSLDEGVQFQGDNMIMVAHAPSWLYYLPFKRIQYVAVASSAMRKWFNSSVAKKKAEIAKTLAETDGDMDTESLKKDVFSRITLASQVDSKFRLEDSEIIGNTWIMYFAGHDTTAGVLAAAFCLLAAHKHEQEVMFNEIKSITKDKEDEKLDFGDYDSLTKTRSVFVESLRMFPAGNILIRETREDTVLHVPSGTDANGNVIEEAMPVPKGTPIIVDMIGIQYNPRTFPVPGVFRPSRWYGATTDESYTGFSGGPRACIGRRFALVEGVCFLAHVVQNFEVEPLLENGETLEVWKKRVLDRINTKMTLSIADSPLVFRRRGHRV